MDGRLIKMMQELRFLKESVERVYNKISDQLEILDKDMDVGKPPKK